MNSTSTVRRTAVAVGAAAVLGMGVLGACGTKEKDKPAETSPPASSSATAPATPTEKAVGPGARSGSDTGNSFTPSVKARPAPTALPGNVVTGG